MNVQSRQMEGRMPAMEKALGVLLAARGRGGLLDRGP